MNKQKQIVSKLADTLADGISGTYDAEDLVTLLETASRFIIPIMASVVTRVADEQDSFAALAINTTHLFGTALVTTFGSNDAKKLPPSMIVKLREISLGVARIVAKPVGTESTNWRRANAAFEFVCAVGVYTDELVYPVDAVWGILSRSLGATMTTNTLSYRGVNWYGMLTRIAITQSVMQNHWASAANAMSTHPSLAKEVVVQIQEMEVLEQAGEMVLATARSFAHMAPRKPRDDDVVVDDDVVAADGLHSWLRELMASECLDGSDLSVIDDPMEMLDTTLAPTEVVSSIPVVPSIPVVSSTPVVPSTQQTIDGFFFLKRVPNGSIRRVDYTNLRRKTTAMQPPAVRMRYPKVISKPTPTSSLNLICNESYQSFANEVESKVAPVAYMHCVVLNTRRPKSAPTRIESMEDLRRISLYDAVALF